LLLFSYVNDFKILFLIKSPLEEFFFLIGVEYFESLNVRLKAFPVVYTGLGEKFKCSICRNINCVLFSKSEKREKYYHSERAGLLYILGLLLA